MSVSLQTDVDVCNLALTGMLGKPTITSLTQNNVEAQRCALFYPMARDEIAQASNWTFLRERASLAEISNTQERGWLKAYDAPSRALKLMYLYEPDFPLIPVRDYAFESGVIFASISPAYAFYITLEDRSPAVWPIHFKRAIAARLAELLAPGMTRRASDVNAMRELSKQELALAIERDASVEYVSYTEDESYVYGVDGQRAAPPTYDGSTFWRR